jgi:hypothetical protein
MRIVAQFGPDFGRFFHGALTKAITKNAIWIVTIGKPRLIQLGCKIMVRLP